METFKILDLSQYSDKRGLFVRTFDQDWLDFQTIQCNISVNPASGTLRGLHFQKSGPAENKIVTLITGSAFLVIVDLRKSSPDYLKVNSILIDSPLSQSIYIPSGYATGWISMSNDTSLQYLMSAKFEDCSYGGIRYNDPILDIHWPTAPVVISDQDNTWPNLEFEV